MQSRTVQELKVSAYSVPTESPESDGTLEWTSTTLVLVEITAQGKTGIGYSYADVAAALLVKSLLFQQLSEINPLNMPAAHAAMVRSVRNLGRPGVASMAIAAVDNALWDLKAKILEVSLADLLGCVRPQAEVYASGGFTSYSPAQLQEQLGGWAQNGFTKVKMKVGRDPEADIERVRMARQTIGPGVDLYVDANGAYSRKQALLQAEKFTEQGVCWFEEPVSSDDLEGLRLIRDRAPIGMDIAAGEYGYDSGYFRRMISSGAVDVLQADATRCAGITGFLEAGILAHAFHLPFSFHCAPSIHVAAACAATNFWVGEYFFDHARIENMLFDGALIPQGGKLTLDRTRAGFGLEFKHADAQRFAA